MKVFALIFGFLKIRDRTVIAFEDFHILPQLANTTSYTVHCYNLHAYLLLHYDWHVICM